MKLKFGDPESIRMRDAAISPIQQMWASFGKHEENICMDCQHLTLGGRCRIWMQSNKPILWDSFNKACGKFDDH